MGMQVFGVSGNEILQLDFFLDLVYCLRRCQILFFRICSGHQWLHCPETAPFPFRAEWHIEGQQHSG